MKVRKLVTRDLFSLAKIMGKFGDDMKPIIGEIQNEQALGFMFLSTALKHADEDFKSWVADLVGIEPNEVDEQPIEFLPDVLEALAEQEDLPGFFARARGFATKMMTRRRPKDG